jgi:thioredoxin 1
MIKVIKFSATWCGPCKTLAPVYNEAKSEISGVSFQEVDVDSDSASAIKYNVRSVPTIVIEKDGSEVKRISGMTSKTALTSLINSYK